MGALGFTIAAALLASTGVASATVIQLTCRGAVGEDQPTEFTISIDLASSGVTEGDFRWTTADDDATIDWDLHRQSGALRGVVLTGADAGVSIVGECESVSGAQSLNTPADGPMSGEAAREHPGR